ncbi:MAG: TatD family hydrolase [Muribaculaceae bacterium]|nr:TatD family hydrolase [Muribaculaceae bacterium]
MIDTHTHLYMPEFAFEGQDDKSFEGQCDAVDRAVMAGVEMMILPNVDRDSVSPLLGLHRLRPDSTAVAMGLHPTEVRANWREELDYAMSVLGSDAARWCAVGEVGIDLYWDKTFENEQMQAFDIQAARAQELGLPLIIHCRDGLSQTLEVLQGHKGVDAVFHSFGGSEQDAEAIKRAGDGRFYFGINGIVTFKNSSLRTVLPVIGADRLLIETDSPYLAPVPHRGRRNESAYITHILATVAHALGISAGDAEAATTQNTRNLFRLS